MMVWECAAGDTFDLIAMWVYGNEKYAAELLFENPQYSEVIEFVGGERIILPEIDVPDEEEYPEATAPWR